MKRIEITVNGKPFTVEVDPLRALVDVLREDLGLTGTKVNCRYGMCGCCTVVLDGKTVYSCLTLAVQAHGRSILTIEGLAGNGELHPLQRAFMEHHGLQCGYCTPGMILSAKTLLEENPRPSRQEIKAGIAGNLCRCTGYHQIIESIEACISSSGEAAGPARDRGEKMVVEGTFSVSAPRETVWESLRDPEVLGGALPGMKSVEVLDENRFSTVMSLALGNIRLTTHADSQIVESERPSRMVIEGQGRFAGLPGTGSLRIELRLAAGDEEHTDVHYTLAAKVFGGPIATLGQRIMQGTVAQLAREFEIRLKARLQEEAS